MSSQRIYAVFLRQWYLIRGNATRFLQMFIWITVDIVMWGFLSKYLGEISGSGFNFVSVFLGAILLWDFQTQIMQGVTMSFFEDVWSRNFLNIFASPMKISEYVTGFALASIFRGILALIVMLILASLIFGFSALVYGTSIAVFLLILFIFGIALGIVGVSIVLRLGPAAEWFIWPIPALLSPFVGVLYPLTILPQWMQYIGHALPPSYVFAGIRAIVNGGTFPGTQLFLGIVLSLVYLVIAYFILLAVYKKAIRSGLIARYSAETVN
jgi:ABC-2 type transport system permease protein